MIFASNNKGKLKEIRDIFNEYQIYSLNDKGIDLDVKEDQDTFYGNALKKAKEIYDVVKEPVIADDSGLCINALDGFPGVLTKRFLGKNTTFVERNTNLIERLKNIDDRSAQVICDLVYYDGENTLVGEGIIDGFISFERRGNNGFGFDEIFEIDGKTLAELDQEEKNKISARAKAAIDLKQKILNLKG